MFNIKEKRIKEMLEMLTDILPEEVKIISFDYNGRFFGNIIVELSVSNKKHVFVTDRGEIYHNGKLLCDSSYHYFEKQDTFSKLLQLIKSELNLEE
jgi:hypothetical protein